MIGPVAGGVVASIQSSEAIRIAAGLRPALLNKLLVVDLNNGIVDYVELQRDPKCPSAALRGLEIPSMNSAAIHFSIQ